MEGVEIELCGHKGKITNIYGFVAQPPWRPKDMLGAWIEFDEPCPEGINAMAIDIPAKEYYPNELRAIIKKEGEKQVARAKEQRIKERTTDELRQRERDRVEALALKAKKALE
jgi:hypothetical protein